MHEVMQAEAEHRRKAWPGSKLTKRMQAQGYRRVVEVAEATGVHRTTVYRWIRDGVVEALDFQGAYYVRWSSVVEHLGEVARVLGLTVQEVNGDTRPVELQERDDVESTGGNGAHA